MAGVNEIASANYAQAGDNEQPINLSGKKELSKDDFLKLLLKQMQMQDPLKPFDDGQMLQEMAQLTSLTASENLQKSIFRLTASLTENQAVSAAGLVNRKVEIPSPFAPLLGDGLRGSVFAEEASDNIKITIKDDKGNVVKTITKSAGSPGMVDFNWDGVAEDGTTKEPGIYTIEANTTLHGQNYQLQTLGAFRVGSIAYNKGSGHVSLNLDDYGGVDMDYVIKII